jgi:hypothetical protein
LGRCTIAAVAALQEKTGAAAGITTSMSRPRSRRRTASAPAPLISPSCHCSCRPDRSVILGREAMKWHDTDKHSKNAQ